MSGYPYGGLYGGGYSGRAVWGGLDTYGSLALTVQSPAQSFVEPLTLQEVLNYLRISIPQSNTDENNQILNFISAAREQAEILQDKDLVQKQWDLSFDYWANYRIELREPLVSVDRVQYTDSNGNVTALNPATDYFVDTAKSPGLITPPYNANWPSFTPAPSSAVLIRFTSGYSPSDPFWNSAGARVKIGMKLLISAWHNNRMPFEMGASAADEYPYAVTSCLSYGARVRAR